mgnify:CR=1 FL=1
MEGGQKSSINLEAGLDVTTSDMLVPVASPTFQHNWQKYQGKFLPNSLRFEKNGWAAGWNVYNFDYNIHREEQNGRYVGSGQLNTYVKTLSVYETEGAYNPLHTVYVIPETAITVGDLAVSGNKITGKVQNKAFTLTWDPVNHTLSCSDPTIGLEYVINGDYSVAFTVADLSSSFSYNFNILLSSSLSGDYIDAVKYTGFNDNKHSWGQYVYDMTSGVLTTPEGVEVTPTVSGNTLSFDYDVIVIDETLNVSYSLEKYYPRFSNITYQDQTSEDKLLINSSGSESLAFNKYKASIKSKVLNAKDEDGVIIDWQLPLWITAKLGVTRTNPEAKKCNNVSNYEVATMQGNGINMSGTCHNIWEGDVDITIQRVGRRKFNTISDLPYRFNQILLDNTIELDSKWDYRKYLFNSQVWYLDSRRYANIRSKRTAVMTKLLGNVYTWGMFSIDPSTVLDYNNPYNVSDKDNCVYTMPDISEIYTFKTKGSDDNTDEGNDLYFVESALNLDFSLIATFSGTVNEYVSGQTAQEYAVLYTDGTYIGSTYETVGVNEDLFWPFEKVPRFNFKDSSGDIHYGVYWTNGADFIDDFDEFRLKVLGTYADSLDTMDVAIKENIAYNRTRVVNQYAAGYDFDFLKKSSYSKQEDYIADKDAWNSIWEKYYPDTSSPQDIFDENNVSDDLTYLDFYDIIINTHVDPDIKYVEPGVYIHNGSIFAVPFNCSSGLIMYSDNVQSYSLTANIWHHATQVDNQYTLKAQHEYGIMRINKSNAINIPFYFGKAQSENLVYIDSGFLIFRTHKQKVSLKSAKLTIGVNYDYEKVEHTWQDSHHNTLTSIEWEWTQKTARSSSWLGHLLMSYGGDKAEVRQADLNTGVTQVCKYYATGDINSGVMFAWPVWGHSQTRLTYPEIKSYSKLNDEDSFVLESVLTADLTNTNTIYFDRDDTDKSQKLFNIKEVSTLPDAGNNTGNLCLRLEFVNGAFMYYAKKQYDSSQQERIMDYYIPGVAWGDPNDSTGYLDTQVQSPILELDWVPVTRKFPTSAFVKFSDNNSLHSSHRFYESDKSLINNISCVLGEIDFDNLTQDIILSLPTGDYVIHYDSTTGASTVDPFKTILTNTSEKVIAVTCTGLNETATIPLFIKLNFTNNKASFIKLSDYTLVSSDGDKCVITDGASQVTYSVNQQSTVEPETGVNTNVVKIDNGQHVSIEGKSQVKCAGYLKAVYDGTITGNNVSFKYQGSTYTWDFSQVIDTGISVLSTDIRSPEKTNVIGKLNIEGQYQLLRQQWNTTVEVENFWWIDSTHVLELNQYSFVLKRNTKELDDWNGERFIPIYTISRDKILPTNITRYFTTNVYSSNRSALFVTIQEDLGSILLTLYNPHKAFEVVGTQRIRIRQRDIGQQLNDQTIDGNDALFNTYNPLTASQVISKAIWSNTITGNWLIIGCHLSNNYDQWAIVINLNTFTLTKVIQGYGYVGLHGELTGGQIPNDYFNVNQGFNGTVQPLTVLKSSDQDLNDLDAAYEVKVIDEINNIEAKVVGTSEQQWYIQKKLHGIVSHLTFNDGNFTKQLLPVTNNFTAVYASPSFKSSVLGDLLVQVSSFESLFSFNGAAAAVWKTFISACGAPQLYSIAPRYAQLGYLQQTFGQYAYVHYNSSKSMPEKEIENSTTDIHSGVGTTDTIEKGNKQTDPVLSSDFTFDKQKFTQYCDTELNYNKYILALLIGSFAESLQFLDKKTSINEEVNTSAVKDTGRKFVENAVANTSDMLSSAIITQSKNDSGLTSSVTGLKSLDMFYSTSDQQHVYAGPGFVEHQMVANCVAQSVTDTQVEGKVQQLYFCIRALTTLQVTLTIKVENMLADAMDKAADATAKQMVCGTSLGAVAVGMYAASAVIRSVIAVQENALVQIEKILDAICVRGITVNVDGQVSRHALSVEGKHKYGEKNEVFMWPCFGIQSNQIKYTDEYVDCGIRNTPWRLDLHSVKYWTNGHLNSANVIMSWGTVGLSQNKMSSKSKAVANCGSLLSYTASDGEHDFGVAGDTYRAYYMVGNVPFYQASVVGKAEERTLPDDMACVEGVCRFLPNEPFKNENIAVSDPAFAPSMQQDYIIDKNWDLAQYCTYGMQQWVTVKDTKVIDCPPSNMIVNDTFCGIASPYAAVEVKRGIEKAYMRPWAVTPNTLAFNCTGYNSILDNKLYHAFDGISYRLVNLVGAPGMNKNRQSFWYAFQINDRFKRSNKVPANELQGNFESEPIQAVASIDKLYTLMTIASKEKGLEAGTIGEDKDLIRWAIPVFTEHVSTLPAAVKTMTAMSLGVVEGITSLCVDLANNQSAYKAPLSVDFTIGKNVYRATEEYICSVQTQNGIDIVTDLIPTLGLKYIGATPTEAFFYSKSTRCYYSFSGSTLTKIDMMERFRDIQNGYWDFVNQEVVMPCLMTFKRLNPEVLDTDTETDNIIVPVLSKGTVSGELPPPITTVFNDRSWYKVVSLPSGLAYQGPNRVIINRNIFVEYMERSIKSNLNKWKKMDREKYVTKREYPEQYDNIMQDVTGVDGWTYNPFLLVTSPLGLNEDTDCIFEWTITFCWPIEMDVLYGVDNYAVVNITAETMTPGGKVKSRPTHVFLTKELFTRNGNYGYYSFRFQSKNGAGNRERLHIWSDQYIAISSIDCEYKPVTSRRTEQLTQQIDIQRLKEL